MDEKRVFIEPNHPQLSVRQQCQLLGFNRSSLYYTPQPKAVNEEQLTLMRLVDEIYTRYPFFGTRQMTDYITLHRQPMRRHQIRWVYQQLGLQSIAPGPHTSQPHPEHQVYPYLLRDMEITQPFQVWSTDISYIRLHHGFAYLMAIIDWYSRFVLDWQLSISLDADFCIETLERVLARARCDIFNTGGAVYQFGFYRFT